MSNSFRDLSIENQDFHVFSFFDMLTIRLHRHLSVQLVLILRLKQYFDMTNVLNYKYGIQLVKNVIEQ